MHAENAVALREWAALCDRLAAGDQILLLRTGGIHERAFRGAGAPVEHREFWLLPTYLHESAGRLVPEERARFDRVAAAAPPEGQGRIELYAQVMDATFVDDRDRLSRLEPFHAYAPGYVRDRFGFREPGLWAITLRVYQRALAHELVLGPEHAGCVSWIRIEPPLSTDSLAPVLDDAAFAIARDQLAHALGPDAP